VSKKLCLAVLFLSGLFSVYAQDLIVLKNGNIIEGKVAEISSTEIKYRRANNLNGPMIVIPADSVLSIRYENGTTDIISDNVTPTPTASTQPITLASAKQFTPSPRLNTLGVTFGYQGVSAFGFTVNGTVSPGDYTFFDFNLGLGFMSFTFNARVNFNAFVPFTNGGWYAGIGIGGGYNESFENKGVIAGNITTGFIFFNWLNIGYTLQVGNFDGYLNHNAIVGYAYRFKEPPVAEVVEYETSAENFIIRGTTLVRYRGNARNVTIPEGITRIGINAFNRNKNVTNITIPESVTSIGESAFAYCTNLTNINIPAGVKSFNETFKGCSSLTNITFSEGSQLQTIGEESFEYCTSLTSISIPNRVTRISERAFSECTNLTSIIIPARVTHIEENAFKGCTNLTTVIFEGNAITSMRFGREAFPQAKNSIKLRTGYLTDGAESYTYTIGGNNLRTAYLKGGAGTYTRDIGGSVWTKQ